MTPNSYDLICIGAGPTGLSCAIEAKRAGLRPLVIDKGCLCNSLYHYPTNMLFFTTPERMEIGDLPMTIHGGKPTRVEALKYYCRAAEHYELETRLYETVDQTEPLADKKSGGFVVHTQESSGARNKYRASKVVIATGYYDLPNWLGVPGEELPHVSHYFTDAHPYWNQDVIVIGGKNSAAETALELFRARARVTLVHRGPEMRKTLKYWVKPDIENRIRAGEINAIFNSHVTRIEPRQLWIKNGGRESAVPATRVFAMTGYHPDFELLERQGIYLEPKTRRPHINPQTLETNVSGLYVAGVIVGGKNTSEIFIENGRFHGRQIVAAITGNPRPTGPAPVSPPGE